MVWSAEYRDQQSLGEVGPEQVVDDAGDRDVQCAPQASDLVYDADLGREAAY